MQTYQGSAFSSSETSPLNYLNEIDQNVIGKYYLKKFNQLNNPRARQIENSKQKNTENLEKIVIQQRSVQFIIEPIYKLIEPINKFYIYGDFPVEADFFSKETSDLQTILEESKQWTQWKQCVQVQYNHQNGFLELFQKSNNSGLSDYQYIVNILQSLQDQRMYELSQIIQSYGSAILNNLTQIKQIFKFVNNNPQLVDYLENRFVEFQQKGLKWIQENIDSNQYYTYVFGKIDFKEECYYNYQEGFSSGLLQILGLDVETAARIILKVGKLEFIDQYGRFIKLYKKLVFAISRKREQQEELNFSIVTVDGYKIPVKVLVINPPIQMSDISIKELLNVPQLSFNQILTIFQYQIEPAWLKFLQDQRQDQHNLKLKQLDQAILQDFSCMNDPFIDKYYKQQFQQIKIQSEQEKKICGFTVLN
ncbi:hypothetical protein TTHERM_00527120 (macronuclear) [Tetrahymena thermophila SB210]|uniref:Uncharacterized protein n=1 Tax=Tetrahymena thermophila (strain SB210) TaxID=312017 RepID=I7MK64_TETTS|nr:hypothetical protein TTHERM_00527120 [Tetrahymena thermophila SB210]EAS07875.2 hypothetical protein TTHERM_00527120 [Tetrahymena thermophila SB210]|eukprot:XP_001028117.2 hypothetical protein TTHERM_00527120 [Tetrahymena thermophila SB210]